VGELNFQEKIRFLSNARATLCPITWPEPFGLVLIESMACGTPVLALRDGSIPEIIWHGKTGFIADSVDEMVQHLQQLTEIDRRVCRHHVETHFSVERMTDGYLSAYGLLVEESGRNRYHKNQQPLGLSKAIEASDKDSLEFLGSDRHETPSLSLS
jgi:glycosyltransferase involved in cell wall biosynthesis